MAAYLGGDLVYGERLGVDHAPQEAPGDFMPVADEAELRDGQPPALEKWREGVSELWLRGSSIAAIARAVRHPGCAHSVG